jgi:thiosulfate/3-mercaptopyruvate sulfurtransferase
MFAFAAARLALLPALAGVPAGPLAAQDRCGERAEPAPGLLVSADWLKRHLADTGLVVLQVERSRAPYDSAHVAGAQFVAMGDFTEKHGDLLTELPPLAKLDSLLEAQGIGERGRIVLYGDLLPVTRLFFTLDYLGLGARVSVVDGGLAAWSAAHGAVTSLPAVPATRGSLTLHPKPELLADAAFVNANRGHPGTVLLDARNQGEFDGSTQEDGVARPGHIPGARLLDWTTLVDGGRFKPKDELTALFTAAGAGTGRELVAYCRVGTRASALYFAGRLLGLRMRLYDGSMNDWASRSELPVSTGPKP